MHRANVAVLKGGVPPTSAPSTPPLRRFLRRSEVLEVTALSSSALYELIGNGKFPRQVRLTGLHRDKGAVVWIADEIAEWQRSRIAERDSPPPEPT